MSAADYPPVRGPSDQMATWALFHGTVIPKEEWTSWTFSEAFKDRYGVPITHWSHWNKLTSFPCRVELLPHPPVGIDFFYFCRGIDKLCEKKGYNMPERVEMEALYTQYLLRWYDKDEDTDDGKKIILRDGMRARLSDDAETYWLKKQDLLGLPDSAVARLDETAAEPESDRMIDFKDGGRMEVEYGAVKQEREPHSTVNGSTSVVRGRTKTKKGTKVKPVRAKEPLRRQLRKERREKLKVKMLTMTTKSMVAMRATLEALVASSAATCSKQDRAALRKQKSRLRKKMREEAERETVREEEVGRPAPVLVKAEPGTGHAIAERAAEHVTIIKQEPTLEPMTSLGMLTLAFRPR